MRYLFFLLLPAIYTGRGLANDGYAAAKIAPEMLRKANAVVRFYDLKFEVLNKGEAIETERRVITLLNEKAGDELERFFYYDKITRIDNIEGAVYDAAGKQIRQIGKKDIEDAKHLEYFVNDNRIKVLRFPRLPFPYTIEYTVTRKYNGLMFYPVFEPQESPGVSVETARFEVVMPPGLEVRVKEKNVPQSCKTAALRWEFKNLPAFLPEPFAPADSWNLPRVLTAPTVFTIEGYDGDMSSWQSFGRFILTLNAGKDQLPPETEAKLKQLTADCTDDYCKIRRVYEFMQNHTRYYFVGLGIGGWQPAPALEVDRFKYGDCKGLSNYMIAMLRAVGIPACYVLIRASAGEQNAQFPDFPNAWFNHAIACVPMERDTLWLECTSQTESCGFLGDFTDNRPALLITPEGGWLVQTPKYDEQVNIIRRETQIALATDGSANLQSKAVFTGIAQDIPAALADLHDEKRKKYLYDRLNISDFEIVALEFERKKERLPEVTQHLGLAVPRFASVSGKRLFVPLSALSEKLNVPVNADSVRHFPVQAHSRGLTEEDNFSMAVPEGYTPENLPAPVLLSSQFGYYSLSCRHENNTIYIYRKLVWNNSIHPKEQYGELIQFLKNVIKADKTKIVLVKG
ncbi:MAG: DUF3857 domain-containing protein [Thermoanaerobaculia bacterium]|nr:DUF3857 domain-containing protein [Thermoanaerobaculia bacterium]